MKYPVCENILKKFLFCVAVIFLAAAAESREITDMVGRKVIVPEIIRRVYSSMPPVTYMIYAVDPDLLIGLDSLPTEHERKELQKKLSILPRIKGSPGQGHTVNVEVLLKMKPDVVVIWNWKQKVPVENPQFDEIMHKAGIPVVYMTLDSVSDYPEAFLFLGRLLGREERARTLSKYGKDAFSETHRTIAAIPSGNLPGVYYAEGVDGLSTECDDSIHAELIVLAGGWNVHQCSQKSLAGMEKVSIEQVIRYNPDVIIAQEKTFYDSVLRDSRWHDIKAVRMKHVYLIPRIPFNWFDRPPSFMRFLGLKWLTNILHPDIYRINITKETGRFYRLFLGQEVSDKEIRKMLNP